MKAGPDIRQAGSPADGQRSRLVFDDECAFCRRWAARCKRIAGINIECVPSRDAEARCPQLSASKLAQAVHLIEPGGRVSKGAEAAVRAWALSGRGRFPLWLYRKAPGVAGCMEFFYRLVARHRRQALSTTAPPGS